MFFFSRYLPALALLGLMLTPMASAGPLTWAREKLGGKPDKPKPGVVSAREPGALTVLLDQPTRFVVDGAAAEAELPRGRSYFRRIELARPLEQARIDVRVIAQEVAGSKSRGVFKPLFYLLDDEGNVRETVAVEPLRLDIRPFQPTALIGCVMLKNVSRFLVATTPQDPGSAFETGARDSVKAASKGGFYYTTDAVKVKLPYVDTGELVMTVTSAAAGSSPCDPPKPAAATAESGKSSSAK